jgi:glucokinase
VIIGVDLGGTNVRGAVVADNGSMTNRHEMPSFAREGVPKCLRALRELILAVAGDTKPDAVGIAIPGHIDAHEGIVHWAPNFGEFVDGKLKIWEDVDVFTPLQGITDGRIAIGNDANLAALGEYTYGSGERKADCMVLYTLGTGVGTGVVISPKSVQGGLAASSVFIGHRGGGPEMGHVKVVTGGRLCSCGSHGCLEAYCGTAGLLLTAQECGATARSPRELFDVALASDDAAITAWRIFGEHLGSAVANTINIWAPDIVAIGGQVAGAWDFFAPALETTALEQSISSLSRSVRIVRATEYDDAGILGAAALARAATS